VPGGQEMAPRRGPGGPDLTRGPTMVHYVVHYSQFWDTLLDFALLPAVVLPRAFRSGTSPGPGRSPTVLSGEEAARQSLPEGQ
jgi:hypothetical protein